MTSRYEAQIRRIIRQAGGQQPTVQLSWRNHRYLTASLFAYLQAKQTRQTLSPLESRLLVETAKAREPTVSDYFYVAPEAKLLPTLAAEAASEAKAEENGSLGPENWPDAALARDARLVALGTQLTSAELAQFSLTARPGWAQLSRQYLQELLIGFAETQPLTRTEMATIIGERLTEAYWQLDPQTSLYSHYAQIPDFFDLLAAEGDWLLDLIDLIKADDDHAYTTLTILWLRWFKHGKTFLSYEPLFYAQALIRVAKHIITALQQRDFDQAGTMLIKELLNLWD